MMISAGHGFPHNILSFIGRDIPRIWFKIIHGFDYTDCWSLDVSLAEWLIPRLKHMSKNVMGSPFGHGSDEAEIKRLSDEGRWNDVITDHDKWKHDIMKAALQLDSWLQYSEFRDPGIHWQYETEEELRQEADRAFKWVAKNIWALWD